MELSIITILSILFLIYLIVVAIFLIMDNRPPAITMAWLLAFIALPVLGFVAYFFTGRNLKFLSQEKKLAHQAVGGELVRMLKPLLPEQKQEIVRLKEQASAPAQRRLPELLHRMYESLLTRHNTVEILQNASVKYPRLLEDMRQAKDHIHLEYFIWQADEFGEKVGEILMEQARQGVKVRLLYDAAGSISLGWSKKAYTRKLREAGVEIYPYLNFLSPVTLHTLSYRNHRKIAVIDGKIGYTGGLNMGQEHLDGAGRWNTWRDTHLRLTGEAVRVLQGIFTVSWFNTTKEKLYEARYFPPVEEPAEDIPVQIVLAGPDSQWAAIRKLYFFMILGAEKHVYIQSPFFIPDETISEALRSAALSGVDVRLMIAPEDTEQKVPNWAANTYFKEMVQAGVRVFLYQAGYLHAKTISIDSAVCSIGTANMDIRSFSIDYEAQAVIYDQQKSLELERAFYNDLEQCTEFSLPAYQKLPVTLRFRDSCARLLSPLL